MEKRVAIIGAGISGLLACKYTLSKGFNPVVFEAKNELGGVWNQTIESTRLQNAKDCFQFSDFPWPSSVKDVYPKNKEVFQYLQSYARHFGLLEYIKFNSKVISIDYVGVLEEEMERWDLWAGSGEAFGSKGKWNITVVDTKDESTKEYVAEFVVLCTGRFSGPPNYPQFSPGYGPEVFSGKVLHSMDYSAMDNASAAEFIKGKRIAVVGSGKSAVDIAFECANANGKDIPCTMVQRTIHWMMLPDARVWGVGVGFLCYTRFFEFMVHKPGEGFFSSLLATLLSPLRWGVSKFVESNLRWRLPLKKYNMIPKESFVAETSSCQILFLPEKFYDKVEDGSIVLKRSQNFRFCKEGLMIDGEDDPLKVDIIIFATGYKGDEKLKNIFAHSTFQKYIAGTPNSILPLYRQMIPPRIPQLAIIGYSDSLSHLYTFEMRCKWLALFLDQAFKLPNIKEMEKDIKMWENYLKKYAGNGQFRRACIASANIWYNDQLCKDTGFNPRRKKGLWSDLFEPYGLADYNGLGS